MPQGRTKKPTDWRQQLKDMGELGPPRGFGPEFRGWTLMAKGERTSKGNLSVPAESREQMLQAMQDNLEWRGRQAKKKKGSATKTIEERLKGLFGSG